MEEVKTDVITGEDGPGTYAYEVSGDIEKGFTITNTHTPEKTTATVVKVWDDNDDENQKRPESISVKLSDGTSVTLSEKNDWTETVEDLPKFKNGEEIEYTWTEEDLPDDYELTDISVNGTVTTLTNSFRKRSTVSIDPPVKKVVRGSAPSKPETYTFKLEAGDASFPMPEAAKGASTMTMDLVGPVSGEFGIIEFTEPGEYTYTVTEIPGSNPNCDYDSTVYKVKAIVTVKSDGDLEVERQYYKNGTSVDIAVFEFVNTYKTEEVYTGDNTGLFVYMMSTLTSGLGLCIAFLFKRRRKYGR